MFLWVGSLFSQVKHWKISWLAYMQSQPAMTLSRQCFPTTRRRHSIPSYSCEVSGPLWLRMLSLFFMLSRLVPASIVFLFSQKQVVVMTTTLTLSFLWCRNWTDWEYLQTIERICGQREQWTTTRSHTQNQQRDANAVARQRRYFLRYTCFYPCRFTTQPLQIALFHFSSICVSRDYFCFLACILHNRNNFSTVDGIHCMHSLPSPRNISLGTRSGKTGQHGRNGPAPEEIEISKIML